LRKIANSLGAAAIQAPLREPALVGASATSVKDESSEFEYAARWARSAYEEQRFRSTAVAVPDLASHRTQVERIFNHVFYPSRFRSPRPVSGNGTTERSQSVFHIGAGRPLANEPLVANALLFLELARPRIHHADAGALLRSPFLAGAIEERDLRAQADFALRRNRELDYSLRDIEYASRDCPKLSSCWPEVRTVLRNLGSKQELGGWARFIAALLAALGWPGDRDLHAAQQDVLEKWEDALSRLAALGLVMGAASLDEGLAHLRRILAGLHLETGDLSSPVQVLDASDIRSLEFDCALLTGLSDESWPPPARTSPLVPLTLQRAHQVPGSTPATARREREHMTERLFSTAPTVAVTYTGRLSPLAEPFIDQPLASPAYWAGVLPREGFQATELQELEDTYAPPFQQTEATRGGTSIIKSQSHCPFRAVAEFRLHARTPDDASFGLDSRERGGFLHRALQNVWTELKTQDRLLKASIEELQTIVRAAIDEAVKTNETGPLHVLVSNTERARLEEVILEWLTKVERCRKVPFTVESMEQERFIEFPGLRLRLRADRIDRLKDGRILLFDYKSGAQSKKKLDIPRPQEPQLLLYAASMEDPVDGVFFGEMRARNTRAVGYSRAKYFPGTSSASLKDWDDFLEKSTAEVERLAEQFVSGYAAVDPLRNVCGFCGLDALCRINERVREAEDDEA
jgi:ATP-dependent helicase/nuclease subunit B